MSEFLQEHIFLLDSLTAIFHSEDKSPSQMSPTVQNQDGEQPGERRGGEGVSLVTVVKLALILWQFCFSGKLLRL